MGNLMDGVNTIQDNYEKYKDMFTDKKNDVVTMDSFYQLLVAEMQNQDPLEPTSNTEFISQMASFTSLQAQQDNLDMQQQNYAKSLVGQVVGVSDGGSELKTGTVKYVTYGDTVKVNVDGQNYNLSDIKLVYGEAADGTEATANAAEQITNYGAFASSLIGKEVTVNGTDATGMSVFDRGTASSIEIQDGIVRVVVNGYAYNVTDVVAVADNTAATDNISELLEALGSVSANDENEEIAAIPEVEEPEETQTEADPEANEDIQDLPEDDEAASLLELFQ
ncbi:MAG: flagellar hook capping protein [Oscillospiraceae bacterium]|nr:flagellar hook capping protein [Oscillospiraceae bacterium]